MSTDEGESLPKPESQQILGAAMDVVNEVSDPVLSGVSNLPGWNEVVNLMNESVAIGVHQWFKKRQQQPGAGNAASHFA